MTLWLAVLIFHSAAQSPVETNPPLTTIRTFLEQSATWGEQAKVRLRGTVSHSTSDKTFFIQDGDAGVYVFLRPERAFTNGTLVEVIANPSLGGVSPTLQNCTVTQVGSGVPPEPAAITGAEALMQKHSMTLVRMRGRLLDDKLRGGTILVLRAPEGGQSFEVNLEAVLDRTQLPHPPVGSLLAATGILVLRSAADRAITGASILIRYPADLVVLSGPPFWNTRRVMQALAGVGVALAVALSWVWALRVQVRKQTALLSLRFERDAELRASEDRFMKALLASPDPVLIIRASDEQVLDANLAFERMTGYPRAEVVGRIATGQAWWLEPAACREFSGLMKSAGPVANFEWLFRAKSGAVLTWLLSAEWVEFNKERSRLCAVRDITERKQAEEERRGLQNQLLQAAKLEALGTLAGGIAHDFNNLLAAILSNVDLAAQDSPPDSRAMQSLEEIRKAGLRARDLVTSILDFSRKQPRQKRVIALPAVVEEGARLLRSIVPANFEVLIRIDPDVPPVLADPSAIHQVVMNLGTNAWHAMENMPGQLTLELSTAEVDARSAHAHPGISAGRYACLSVTDRGIGIDAATRERIFEPFFTTKGPGKGTGLGLAAVHGIISDHNGFVAVRSEPGQGSTFTIYLPGLPAASLPAPQISGGDRELRGTGQHILLIDDEPSLCSALRRLMERSGYRVSAFTSPLEAIAAFKLNPAQFDLALSDLNMPQMTGLEVVAALRQIRPELPVVLTSGFMLDDVLAKALAAGAAAVIHKPMTQDDLAGHLARLLG